MPSLLCLIFYDAFSDHAFLFLCVSMHLETELYTRRKARPQGRGALPGWSRSPAKVLPFLTQVQQNPATALPFLTQAQTNTILILNPSFKSSLFPFPRSPWVRSLRPKLKKKKYTARAQLAVWGLGTSTQSISSSGIFLHWIFFLGGGLVLADCPPPLL